MNNTKRIGLTLIALLGVMLFAKLRGAESTAAQRLLGRLAAAETQADGVDRLALPEADGQRQSVAWDSGSGDGSAVLGVLPQDLNRLLLAIAAAEQALVDSSDGLVVATSPKLLADLESAVGPFLSYPESTSLLLGTLSGDREGVLDLTSEETYGAVRAIYWLLVIKTGRGEGRSEVLEVLAALPEIHADARDLLVFAVTNAAANGKLILDTSFLQEILFLRSVFPEALELYSALFGVIGDSLSAEKKGSFFAVFGEETDDPTLARLTIKNLLLSDNPEFGLFLAEQRLDDPSISQDVKNAIAAAVAKNADIYSASSFLSGRAESFKNSPTLWMSLGFRDDAEIALGVEYQGLLASGAAPDTRRLLVSAMSGASYDDLQRLAGNDDDGVVVGQALMTATANRDRWSSVQVTETLQLLEDTWAAPSNGLGSFGLSAAQRLAVVHNLAAKAKKAGDSGSLDRLLGILKGVATDPGEKGSTRASATRTLERYLTPYEIDALKQG
jgi:hypothetical protein